MSIEPTLTMEVFEMGIYLSDGTLLAVASTRVILKLLSIRNMQQSNPILLNQLKQDYIALQQLGSPLLACQGMFVPRGMEDLRFLFKSCPRPIVSNEDPAEVQYAGGFTGIVAGPPKTHYTGNLQILVTEAGHDQLLAEYVVASGGIIHGDYYDGRLGSLHAHMHLKTVLFALSQLSMIQIADLKL